MDKPLINRVAASSLITINLEEFFPTEDVLVFDVKDYLFMDLILKEKDFREALKEHDWTQYEGKNLAVYCSSDAIIPIWAYILVASNAAPFAKRVAHGDKETFYQIAFYKALQDFDASKYQDQRIVIKGCGNKPVPVSAYVELTNKLRPFAKNILFGEPCSTVPIYKRPKEKKHS